MKWYEDPDIVGIVTLGVIIVVGIIAITVIMVSP